MTGRRFLTSVFVLLLLGTIGTTHASTRERVIDLTASDGVKLKASYFASATPGPGVLLLHQCNRDRKIWDGLAQQLADAGINVLTLDLRGFGESGDVRSDKATPEQAQAEGQKWPGDIDLAFNYLSSEPGVSRDVIGVGGASCGVNNGVQTARRRPQVKSLVLLAGSTDLAGRQFLRHSANLPILFGFADDDEFPPSIVSTEWLYSLAADPEKKLAQFPTGGHGAEIFPVHPELPKMIVDWFVTTLIKTPGHAPVAKETPQLPIQVRVLDLIDEPGGAAKVSKTLEDARKHGPKAKLFDEEVVNFMGYEHLQAGDTRGALEILELNAEAYPESPNAYDSLADAYLAGGQKDLALQNSKKALQLLQSDTTDDAQRRDAIKASAEARLRQLAATPD